MAIHRIYHESTDHPLAPGPLSISGDEAHHAARVKRLAAGDPVQVLDGRGAIASGTITAIDKDRGQWRLHLTIHDASRVDPPRPRLEVLSAAPKGGRLEDMIDGLSEVGAASWSLLHTDRGEVDPRPARLDRLARTAMESSKQCGRAWLLEVAHGVGLTEALKEAGPGVGTVIADASGEPYRASGAQRIRVLVGPEGGWSAAELDRARRAGAAVARFGGHTMRIETAAVAAAAIILHTETGGP